MSVPSAVDLGPGALSFARASALEWIVTNGLGGYASGTVAGLPTRRYHGLLVAALEPPVRRTLTLAQVLETAAYRDAEVPLSVTRWADGTADPAGAARLVRFALEGTTPVFTYAWSDAVLERRVFLEPGRNTVVLTWTLARASQALDLRLIPLASIRDHHGETREGDVAPRVEPIPSGVRVSSPRAAFALLAPGADVRPRETWYRGVLLSEERARGFSGVEDRLAVAEVRTRLEPGASFSLLASTESPAALDAERARARRRAHEEALLATAEADDEPAWVRQLVLAADQFVVARPSAEDPGGLTVVAGYPWFADWGRDAMIALPGLALATGRPEVSRRVLRCFARHVREGTIPNRFPDGGEPAEYNAVDATLWLFEAARQHVEAARDLDLAAELLPVFRGILDAHRRGTRHAIAVDPFDGLLRAGEPGVQLTWMDAKVGERVVTPRVGKPVEVNALWHAALSTTAALARRLGAGGEREAAEAERVRTSFARFRDPEGGLLDVLDGPWGDERAVRPNQVLAASLPNGLLDGATARGVVSRVAGELLTPFGLRTLSPRDAAYRSRYEGGVAERDGAYHQGTVWPWLLGPFALAHARAFGDPARARAFLEPLGHSLDLLAAGTLPEILDAEPPHAPRGAPAQAWSVAETLRAWRALSPPRSPAPG